MPEGVVVTPFQVVKVRMQAAEHVGRYTSTAACARAVIAEEGVTALTAGMHATCWRNSVWNGVFFAAMHAARDAGLLGGGDGRGGGSGGDGGRIDDCREFRGGDGEPGEAVAHSETVRTSIIGFFAGVLATCFNCPFDVVKSRVQASRRGCDSGGAGPSLPARLGAIAREEGVRGLYAGFAPKAMRMGLGGAVGITTFELARRLLGA